MITFLLLFYPDGRLPGPRCWVAAAVVIVSPVQSNYFVIEETAGRLSRTWWRSSGSGRPWRPGRARSSGWCGPAPQRQQQAWLVLVVVPCAVWNMFFASIPGEGEAESHLAMFLWVLPQLFTPVAVAVGVLRYRLLGIESVLRRGLVYGTLTVLVFAVYVGVSAVAGRLLAGDTVPALVAAALVALGLDPLRDRLQRVADRIVHGERHDPLRALSRLSQRVATSEDAGCCRRRWPPWPRRCGHRARRWWARTGACSPVGPATSRARWCRWSSRVAGWASCTSRRRRRRRATGRRSGGCSWRWPRSWRSSCGRWSWAQRWRRRGTGVVDAARAERDWPRRDLHDGLGPSLTGMGLGLQAVADLVDRPPPAVTLVERIRAEVTTAVAEIRRIIDDLRPSVLDTAGLAAAVVRHAEAISAALPVAVDTAGLPATLPPAVETAAYRIATEALTNVARHPARGGRRSRSRPSTARCGSRSPTTEAASGSRPTVSAWARCAAARRRSVGVWRSTRPGRAPS